MFPTLPCKVKTRAVLSTALILVPVCKQFSRLVSDFYWLAPSLFPCGYGDSASAPNYPIVFRWQAPLNVVYFAWRWKNEKKKNQCRLIFKSEIVKLYHKTEVMTVLPHLRHCCKQNFAFLVTARDIEANQNTGDELSNNGNGWYLF